MQDCEEIQIIFVTICLIILEIDMDTLFIMKVKILMLIKMVKQ